MEYLEYYRGKKYSSNTREKWRIKDNLLKGNITLEYARVISLLLANNKKKSINLFNNILSSSQILMTKRNYIKFPFRINELNRPELAYLSGVICGDGHIAKDLNELVIADGSTRDSLACYSFDFMRYINEILKRSFNQNCSLIRIKRYWRLRCGSSLICRIMNCVYEIPRGCKCRFIKLPSILKNKRLESLFWRGMFDTDGSARDKGKGIRIVTSSRILNSEFLDFCRRRGIIIFNKNRRGKYESGVAEESVLKFARIIGFSHPRKRKILIEYLKKGASYKVSKNKVPNKKLEKVIEYLRSYKDNVYIRLTKRRENVRKRAVKKRIRLIEKVLNVNVICTPRPRKNDHYYICSKQLVEEINNHYSFVPIWNALSEKEIQGLEKRWELI